MAKKLIKKVLRAVTQDDLNLNPDLVAQGTRVGDMLKLAPEPEADELTSFSDDDIHSEMEEESKPVKSISFKIRNPNVPGGYSIRTFDSKNHGADYKDLADSFREANTIKKTSPDMSQEEKEEVSLFNRTVNGRILSETSVE